MPSEQAKIQTAEEAQDDEGYLDLIIAFLRSPRWKTPVKNFIDEHCIEFEESAENSSEALEQDYMKLHEEYKKIIEDLL